jgi:hypothetical protein
VQYLDYRGISVAKLSIYKYVRTDKGWRYCKAAFHPNGKIKPNVVAVSGVEEKHAEGRYLPTETVEPRDAVNAGGVFAKTTLSSKNPSISPSRL